METAKLKQLIYFLNVLTLKWKSENMLHWGRGYAFVSKETKSYGSLQN